MFRFQSSDVTFQSSDVTFAMFGYNVFSSRITLSNFSRNFTICFQCKTLRSGFQYHKIFLEFRKIFNQRVILKPRLLRTLFHGLQRIPLQFCWYFATMDFCINPKGPPIQLFSTLRRCSRKSIVFKKWIPRILAVRFPSAYSYGPPSPAIPAWVKFKEKTFVVKDSISLEFTANFKANLFSKRWHCCARCENIINWDESNTFRSCSQIIMEATKFPTRSYFVVNVNVQSGRPQRERQVGSVRRTGNSITATYPSSVERRTWRFTAIPILKPPSSLSKNSVSDSNCLFWEIHSPHCDSRLLSLLLEISFGGT